MGLEVEDAGWLDLSGLAQMGAACIERELHRMCRSGQESRGMGWGSVQVLRHPFFTLQYCMIFMAFNQCSPVRPCFRGFYAKV